MRRAPGSLPLPARRTPLVLILAFAGCTSTPQASPERDAAAKRFETRPSSAAVYVYRNEPGTALEPDETVLYVNDRLIGTTVPGSYFRIDMRAGVHLLQGYPPDTGRLKLDVRNGEIYFISLKTAGGTSNFRPVSPETGKRDIVKCCVLFENWAPGQRPLLQP